MTLTLKRAEPKRTRCADYVACHATHQLWAGCRVVAHIIEQWGEDFSGQRLASGKIGTRSWFDVKVGKQLLMMAIPVRIGHKADRCPASAFRLPTKGQAFGNIARFATLDGAQRAAGYFA